MVVSVWFIVLNRLLKSSCIRWCGEVLLMLVLRFILLYIVVCWVCEVKGDVMLLYM